MAYYIAVETERNNYIGINFANLVFYAEEAREKIKNGYTLKDIDNFTSRFENESELKACLVREKIITTGSYDKPLTILFVSGSEIGAIIGDPIYKNDKKMLINPMLVDEYITSRYNECNINFFEELGAFYGLDTVEGIKLQELVSKLKELENDLISEEELTSVNEHGDTMISEIIKLTMLDVKANEDGNVVYSGLNYERLRSIVVFINNYVAKQRRGVKTRIRKNVEA